MLKNKVIVVFGGLGKIGSKLCKSIIANQGTVIIADIYSQKESFSTIRRISRKNISYIKCNITSEKNIQNLIKKSILRFKKIDSVVNCSYPPLLGKLDRIEKIKSINIKNNLFNHIGGTIIFSKTFSKFFLKQGYGNLVHLSSIQGISSPKFSHYTGSKMHSPIEYTAIKSSIISITKYLAKYYKGKNIRVNCVSPGGILDNQPKNFLKKYKMSCTSKGILDPQDITGTLIFLISDDSKYINGQNIVVDDGWSL